MELDPTFDAYARRELVGKLLLSLAKDRPKYARFILLYFRDGTIAKDIANDEGLSPARVNQILNRSLRIMRKHARTRFKVVETDEISTDLFPWPTLVVSHPGHYRQREHTDPDGRYNLDWKDCWAKPAGPAPPKTVVSAGI